MTSKMHEGEMVFSVELEKIVASPRNPRKKSGFEGPEFDGLVASIKEKGVIEPIILRPKAGEGPACYEIVAGERRFRAVKKAGQATIPAIVRDLNDEEAFDLMMIENLQRADLEDREEAESFKAFLAGRGDEAIVELAGKIGKPARYIRGRVAVLDLPKKALDAWGKRLTYSHLEQLLRVRDPKVLDRLLDEALVSWRQEPISVSELKQMIFRIAIPLGRAPFSTKECNKCEKCSKVQAALFDGADPEKGVKCMDRKCFIEKVRAFFAEHWKESALYKKNKTEGFRFGEDLKDKDYEAIYGMTPKRCQTCEKLVTVIDIDGGERFKACLGDKACAKQKPEQGATKKGAKKKDGPRVPWHGEFFRDLWIRPRIEEKVKGMSPTNIAGLTVMVAAAAKSMTGDTRRVAEALGLKGYAGKDEIFKKVLAAPAEEQGGGKKVIDAARAVILAMVDHGASIEKGYHTDGFGTGNRAMIGKFLGIDLAKEFAVNEEYLQKKTKAELLEFGKSSGIFGDPKVKAYLMKKGAKEPSAFVLGLKKTALIDVFLKSGVDLVGKVPAEILNAGGKK